ncbi:adenosylcobinamide-GDP ribazoletransferase [Chloroflexus islandicus]|uniref:Adenosylcobinamide-GDP ribazoletransferase n=1 Tax=Chloroflexus islandicus TaxID=1707952 RepID=A0A178MGI7_9CHLR|nr:adenosylcobinamide-GDP ribazoletransferase [Chloroflexus islandicus]OAN47653.1 adenosylcobinamide-GDP ribazoletransferase [Chloroflexus islandicus]
MSESPARPANGLLEAIRFLTIIPLPGLPPMNEQSVARAIPWFPAAGLVIGGAMVAVDAVARPLWGDLVAAVLAVAMWGIVTGGLHLDGVSDTFDAVMSWRSRERKLEIMKDSRIGAMGAIALIMIILLKVAFIASATVAWPALLLAPMLGRWADCYGIYRFPPAREGGLGRMFNSHVQQRDLWLSSVLMLGSAWLIAGLAGIIAAALVLAVAHLLARWWVRDLGGLTGDTYGALCEIGEVVALAALTIRM